MSAKKHSIVAGCLFLLLLLALNSCFVFRGRGCDCPAYSDGTPLRHEDTLTTHGIWGMHFDAPDAVNDFSPDAAIDR